jgi:hypothetical protein
MSEAVAQQVLRLSNYMASGFPYISGVYVPVINTITNNANIILKKSDDTWYTVRSNSGNSTIDKLVVGDGLLGTFSEISLSGDTITIVGTVTSYYYRFCQIRWWDANTLAIITIDEDTPYALKIYTVPISTGVVSYKGTLIATVDSSYGGLQVAINSTNIYIQTITGTYSGSNNYIRSFLKTDLTNTNDIMPLLYYYCPTSTKYFYIPYIMATTNNYLWFLNYGSSPDTDTMYLWVSHISDIPKMTCVSGDIFHIVNGTTGKFLYQTDYDGTTVYITGNNGTGAFYITESDLIKYGAL